MLSVQLMLEVNRRCNHDAGELLLRDACLQAAYCMDAPDEVQDGMHWWNDPELDVHGAVPRVVELREPANWQFCCDRDAKILKGREDYELRPVYVLEAQP